MQGTGTPARLATFEVRWFAAGPVPAAMADWFARGGEVERSPSRTDLYLRLPAVHDVGVKLRRGRFEIKARQAGAGAEMVWSETRARIERWLKWSAAADGTLADTFAADAPPVLVVGKQRSLLRPWPGTMVELAALAVAGRSFWTFGLEAEAPAPIAELLEGTWAAAAPAVPALQPASYPRWLDRLAGSG